MKRLCIGLALLVLLDTIAWYASIASMRTAWQNVAARAAQSGWRIAVQGPEQEGWPLAARLRFEGAAFTADDNVLPGGAAFSAEHLLAEFSMLHPRTLLVLPQGHLSARVGRTRDVELTAEGLMASVDLIDMTAHLQGRNLRLNLQPEPISALRLDVQLLPDQAEAQIALDNLDLAMLARPWLLDGLLRHVEAKLRNEGGALAVRDVSLDWGRLRLNGFATLQTDSNGLPDGEGRIAASGLDDAINDLVAAGRLTPQNAAAAKLVLALLQRRGADGRMVVDLPLALHNGELRAGQFPLLRLPPMSKLPGLAP